MNERIFILFKFEFNKFCKFSEYFFFIFVGGNKFIDEFIIILNYIFVMNNQCSFGTNIIYLLSLVYFLVELLVSILRIKLFTKINNKYLKYLF